MGKVMTSTHPPRWDYWRQFPLLAEWRLIALSLNLEPASILVRQPGRPAGLEREAKLLLPMAVAQEFTARREVLAGQTTAGRIVKTRHYTAGRADDLYDTGEFVTWAQSVAWEIPPELAEIGRTHGSYPVAMEQAAKAAAPAEQAVSGAGVGEAGAGWHEQARTIADELFNRDTSNGCRDSLEGYSKRVCAEMQTRGIHGPRGAITNHNTIKRDALQGALWKQKKSW